MGQLRRIEFGYLGAPSLALTLLLVLASCSAETESMRSGKSPSDASPGQADQQAANGVAPDGDLQAQADMEEASGESADSPAGNPIDDKSVANIVGNSETNQADAVVQRLYTNLLGREPDPEGLKFYVEKLDQGQCKEAVSGILGSPEAQDYLKSLPVNGFLNAIYNGMFGRAPDPGGLEFWSTRLKNGQSRNEVIDGFLASKEFASACNGDQPPVAKGQDESPDKPDQANGFVQRLYANLLGRAPDPEGLKFYVEKVDKGQCKEAVSGILGSSEAQDYLKSLPDNGFLGALYNGMYGRAPDPGGLEFWSTRLKNGQSRNRVIEEFLAAKEFGEVCKQSQQPVAEGEDKSPGMPDQENGIVHRLYANFLGRAPDPEGLKFYAQKVDQGQCKEAVSGILGSSEAQEYLKGLPDNGFLVALYNGMYGRAPDPGGLEFWSARLKNGQSRNKVIEEFLAAKEFGSACNQSQQPAEGEDKSPGMPDLENGVVHRLYTSLLGRAPDPEGLKFYTQKVDKGQCKEAVSGILGSPEAQAYLKSLPDNGFLGALYNGMFGRAPDPGGLKFWSARLKNGQSRNKVIEEFLASKEIESACKLSQQPAEGKDESPDMPDLENGVVHRLYTSLLGRAPDPEGLKFYGQKLDQGQCKAAVSGILGSPEAQAYLKSLPVNGFLSALYNGMYGRAPDPGGLKFWSARLKNGQSRNQVIDEFLGSNEFGQACN